MTSRPEISDELRAENEQRAHPLTDDELIALSFERGRRRALKARWRVFTDDELAILADALNYVAFGSDRPADELAEHIEAEIKRRKDGSA